MSLLSMPARMMAPARVLILDVPEQAEDDQADSYHEEPVDGETRVRRS